MVIAGPTGVGKTALSILLAKRFKSEIFSADSRQFYKEMIIGTAKPNEAQLKEVKHHFINTKSITELYGAGHFEKDALKELEKYFNTHDIAFVVGGSGLYINALVHGVDDFIEVPLELRERLIKQFESSGLQWLQNEVKKLDETYYQSADTNNPQRLMRALEICLHTGKPYSSFLNKDKIKRPFIPIKLLITTNRQSLYDRINTRVDEMMLNGLLNEVKNLHEHKHLNALKTVGYKELYAHLAGSYSLEIAITKIKQHTRNYAKRQLTWFKNQDTFKDFEPDQLEDITHYIKQFVAHKNV